MFFFFLSIRRPPRSTRTDHSFPTRRSSDLDAGSDSLLSFATLQGLNEAETLACFGRFYREDVPKNPEGSDHRNIRNFMRSGWGGAVRRTGAQDLRLSRGKASPI